MRGDTIYSTRKAHYALLSAGQVSIWWLNSEEPGVGWRTFVVTQRLFGHEMMAT